MRWVRLITDIPAAASDLVRRRLKLRDYVGSLRTVETEASFARDDPRPALAELMLLPHLIRTRLPQRRQP